MRGGVKLHSPGDESRRDDGARRTAARGRHLLPHLFATGLIVATTPAPRRGRRAAVQPSAKESTVAEIKVENRDHRGVPPREGGFRWWWLLPLLLLALLAWYLLRDRDDDDAVVVPATDTTTVVAPAPAPEAAPAVVDSTAIAPAAPDSLVTGTSGTGATGTTQDTTAGTDSTAPRP